MSCSYCGRDGFDYEYQRWVDDPPVKCCAHCYEHEEGNHDWKPRKVYEDDGEPCDSCAENFLILFEVRVVGYSESLTGPLCAGCVKCYIQNEIILNMKAI